MAFKELRCDAREPGGQSRWDHRRYTWSDHRDLGGDVMAARKLLDISHLNEVFQVLKKYKYAGTSFYQFGLSLGLSAGTLDVIEKDHRGDTVRCLLKVLEKWLSQADNVENTKGDPSYYTLITALRAIGENAVADGIDKEKHPACVILARHQSDQSLQDSLPSLVLLLHKEGIIGEMIPAVLLTAVQEAVCFNYKSLKKFAAVLQQFTVTIPVGDAILKDYRKEFPDGSMLTVTDGERKPLEIVIPVAVNSQFTAMRTKYVATILEVYKVMTVSNEDLKLYLQIFDSDLQPRLENCHSTQNTLQLISEKCSLIDIGLLEGIVNYYGIELAKAPIQQYKSSVDVFCQEMSLNLCIDEYVSNPSSLKSETITFIIDKEVDDHKLKDANDLVRLAFEKKAKIVRVIRSNSFTITCSFPLTLSESLIESALENLELLKEKGLLQLTIGYSTVYRRDEEIGESKQTLVKESFAFSEWATAVYTSRGTLEQMVVSLSVQLANSQYQLVTMEEKHDKELISLEKEMMIHQARLVKEVASFRERQKDLKDQLAIMEEKSSLNEKILTEQLGKKSEAEKEMMTRLKKETVLLSEKQKDMEDQLVAMEEKHKEDLDSLNEKSTSFSLHLGTKALPGACNELLDEIEYVLLKELDKEDKFVVAFKARTKNLRCLKKAGERDVKKKMEEMAKVLKSVKFESKPNLALGPPPVKRKPQSRRNQPRLESCPEKLTQIQRSLDISHTVMMTNKMDFNADAARGRAIPLCLPNDCEWNKRNNSCKKIKSVAKDSLVINPDAVRILEGITDPISVVSIVGPCHTGKSYILSRLISSQAYEQPRFKLGHLMDPETMGIWMWDTPIRYQLKNGQYTTIILLDTEGIDAYNADKHGDTQIFTLSVLLSSLLIYNSTQVPQRDDLDQMTFIANLAKSIGSRGSKCLNREEIKQIVPAFLWLLRDATLEPVDSKGHPCHFRDYLIDKVLAVDNSFEEESVRVKASRCLLEFFTSFDAEMIPPPSTSPHVMANIEDPRYKDEISSDFLWQVDYVRRRILDKCTPKRGYTKGSLMNGIQFAGILKMYIDALNSPNGIPKVGSAWDQVMETLESTYTTAISRAVEVYESKMSTLAFPMEYEEFEATHQSAYQNAVQQFKKMTELDSDVNSYEKHFGIFNATIATFSSQSSECTGGLLFNYSQQNLSASKDQCRDLVKKLDDAHLSPLKSTLSSQTNYEDIITAVATIKSNYYKQSRGPAKHIVYEEFAKKLEDERKNLQSMLRQMKYYDAQLQAKQKELEEKRRREEQELFRLHKQYKDI